MSAGPAGGVLCLESGCRRLSGRGGLVGGLVQLLLAALFVVAVVFHPLGEHFQGFLLLVRADSECVGMADGPCRRLAVLRRVPPHGVVTEDYPLPQVGCHAGPYSGRLERDRDMDVSGKTIECFVTVAEELSFTRAAERLHLSQSTISRQIQKLENHLGLHLFERNSREVQMTAVGAAFLEPSRQLLSSWEAAQQAARAAAAQEDRVLRVGYQATGAGPLTTRSRAVFAARFPGVTVEPKRLDWAGEVAALQSGVVDVAFIWLPADLTRLTTEEVFQEPRVVGVATHHRLAGQQQVTLADLRDEPMPWARHAPRSWIDWWAVSPRPDGSKPVFGPPNDNVEELLDYVAAGPGICIVPRSVAEYYPRPGLVWLPLVDAEPLRVAIGWPRTTRNPLVFEFAAVVRELAQAGPCEPASACVPT